MEIKYLILLSVVFVFSGGCRKKHAEPTPVYYNNPTYNKGTGDGNVSANTNVVITYPIQSNLNVDGQAVLGSNTRVNDDLNLNDHGKVVVNPNACTDTIYVNGNVNINDTLWVQRGIVKVSRDFNINAGGVVNCSDSSRIIIQDSLNQSGTLWGNVNVQAGSKKINNPAQTHDYPLH